MDNRTHDQKTGEQSKRWAAFLKTDHAEVIAARYKSPAKQLAELAFEFHRRELAAGHEKIVPVRNLRTGLFEDTQVLA